MHATAQTLTLLLKKSSITSSKLENIFPISANGLGKLNLSTLRGAGEPSWAVSSTVHCFSLTLLLARRAVVGEDAVPMRVGAKADDDATTATARTRVSAEEDEGMVWC